MAARKGKYYFWRSGTLPLEEQFMERFAKMHSTSVPEAYNQVMQVMEVMQDMLLSHSRFMLPGIGVVGIANSPKRGIIISSTTLWWTPGLVNLLAVAPGWENAPLNCKLSHDNLTSLNKHITRMNSKDRILLSPSQFYQASDFNMEGYTSDENMEYYLKQSEERWTQQKALQAHMINYNKKHDKVRYLEKLVKDLGGEIDYDQISRTED